ncbi:CRE-CDH-7 protein [Caenorhabditis remanei]|uniref:CRE-CDH-7 protein n=1 Tax=Caenorhabditis remanei TaxID=31234 RepID=E3MHT1_CAERE|nr:CRE-CDH-7 protein [Caenorhabditis remanei]
MREVTTLLLILQLPIAVYGDLLSIPSTTFKIPRNAQEGDLIFGNGYIRAFKDLDEALNLELEGTNPSPIAINGSIIDAGQPVKFVLVNKNAFENGKSRVKLQAIGVISGKVQEETINFEVESSSDLPTIPEIPNFVVKSDFQDKETAIVKVSSLIPPNSDLEVLGSYAERVQATFQDDNIILDTVPCQADVPCEVTFPFTVILVLRNGENHVEALLTFEEEKKSSLKITQKLYQTTIEEHTGEQDHLVKITAKGATSEILYSLRDSSGLFSIHPKEGILSILHPEFLTIASFGNSVNLTVVATDGEKTSEATIVVNIVPEVEKNVIFGFEKDSYEITAENTNPILGNIKAKSPTPVIYRITEGRGDLYKVETNGDLRYVGKLVKEDREDEITVAVQQSTGGLKMASTKLQIHLKGIGSNPLLTKDPLEQIELISSEEPEGVVVTSIQFEDADQDATLEYTLEQLEPKDENGNSIHISETTPLFSVKSGEDKMAHLVVSGDLKPSSVSTIRLKITADDTAHPREPVVTVTRVVVIQREKSDEPEAGLNLIPMPTNIVVPFDAPIGTFVYRVTVLPAKSDVSYTVEPEHLFNVSASGDITTAKKLTGESENESLKIHVTVKDATSTQTSESTITLKKVARPHFSENNYSVNLPRGTPEGAVLTVVSATNEHLEPAKSFVIHGGHAKYFSIDENGAVRTKEPLDELGDEFDFLVGLAENPHVDALVHVELQKAREPSIVLKENQIFATVYDNLPINSFVGKVEVKNDEKVKFEMNSDEKGMMNLFTIGEDGTIRSMDWLAGSVGMHKFSVLASNIDQAGVRSANATVIIDVIKSNECAPRFKQDENLIFYVRENTPKDTVIGKVSADVLPGKCDLEYSVTAPGSPDQPLLTINPANGELKTAQEFDFEKSKSHLLTLKLVAGKHNSVEMGAELRVIDVDDHELKFDLQEQTVEVAEDVELGTVVATVTAKEDDESQEVWYHLKAGAPPQFSLDSRTGKVMVEQALDREEMDRFVVEIGASNSEPTNTNAAEGPSTKLIVKVKDVNDNGPRFDLPHYFTVTPKDTVVGTQLLELTAHDPDIMDQDKKLEYTVTGASFEYRGMNRNVEDIFDVQNQKLILMKSLMDYVGGVFNVQLQVRDTVDGTIGKAGLRVYVHDSSDLLSLELPYSPSTVSQGIVQEFADQLSNSTGLQAIPKTVLYKAPHGIMSTNSVDLQMIFFNKSMSEIVPAERILAMQEMRMGSQDTTANRNAPILRKPSSPYLLMENQRSDTFIQPELFFIVLGFLVLLAIVLALCGLMACFARSKFLRQKRIMENEMAIKDAIQFPANRSPALVSFKHFAPPITAEMYRNHEEHMYRSPNLNEKIGSYAVQQATITVAEHEEKI